MEFAEDILDAIPESRAARWAYHLAVIPILGVFLYVFASSLALYQIGKGRTGFFWLGKGFWRMIRMSFIGTIAFCFLWFFPSWSCVTVEEYDYSDECLRPYYESLDNFVFYGVDLPPNIEPLKLEPHVKYIRTQGWVMRQSPFSMEKKKVLKWCCYDEFGDLVQEENYSIFGEFLNTEFFQDGKPIDEYLSCEESIDE